jgi:HD-like signal output (HDOD) protein
MCDAETAVIGVPHAELGACLLGIWGLPTAIVEAVALHHHPARFFSKTFCPLTAVHAANSIEHELNTQANGMTVQAVDLNYLTELGLEERYASWRDLCAERVL